MFDGRGDSASETACSGGHSTLMGAQHARGGPWLGNVRKHVRNRRFGVCGRRDAGVLSVRRLCLLCLFKQGSGGGCCSTGAGEAVRERRIVGRVWWRVQPMLSVLLPVPRCRQSGRWSRFRVITRKLSRFIACCQNKITAEFLKAIPKAVSPRVLLRGTGPGAELSGRSRGCCCTLLLLGRSETRAVALARRFVDMFNANVMGRVAVGLVCHFVAVGPARSPGRLHPFEHHD